MQCTSKTREMKKKGKCHNAHYLTDYSAVAKVAHLFDCQAVKQQRIEERRETREKRRGREWTINVMLCHYHDGRCQKPEAISRNWHSHSVWVTEDVTLQIGVIFLTQIFNFFRHNLLILKHVKLKCKLEKKCSSLHLNSASKLPENHLFFNKEDAT